MAKNFFSGLIQPLAWAHQNSNFHYVVRKTFRRFARTHQEGLNLAKGVLKSRKINHYIYIEYNYMIIATTLFFQGWRRVWVRSKKGFLLRFDFCRGIIEVLLLRDMYLERNRKGRMIWKIRFPNELWCWRISAANGRWCWNVHLPGGFA